MTSTESTTLANREAIEGFVEEALDSLAALPDQLQTYRLTPAETAPIHAVFRAIHSMKGCAAFLDLDAIRTFSHELENVLGAVRDETCSLSEELQRSFVEAFDRLSEMLQEAVQGNVQRELDPQQKELLERIKELAFQSPARKPADRLLCEELLALAENIKKGEEGTPETWSESLRALVDNYLAEDNPDQAASSEAPSTLRPTDFLSARCFCGDEEVSDTVGPLAQAFVAAEKEKPGGRTGSLLLERVQRLAERLEGAGDPEAAKCLIHAAADLKMIVDSPIDLDENLLGLIWGQLAPELAGLRASTRVPVKPQSPATEQAAPPQKQTAETAETSEPGKAKSRFVRVKEERLDEFLEYVSRLFIASERFKDVHSRMAASGQLGELVDEIQGIITDLKADSTALQHGAMGLRRVSISGLFSKFPRMARSLASNLGKQIAVHVSGEDTEIDKTLAEDLDSPLTHLIRNVVDHGIETPEQRLVRGVPETGNLWLSAQQTRNCVKIRETVYDAIRLGEVLALSSANPPKNGKQMSALVHSKEGAFCLLVDQVLGHRQVVVSHLKEDMPLPLSGMMACLPSRGVQAQRFAQFLEFPSFSA